MNIAFFGTSDRSAPILDALKNSNFDIVLCVTREDLPVGRKQELKPTGVKVWAEANRVQCLTIDSLRDETTVRIKNLISEKNVQLCLVVDFSFIIPEELLGIPEYKFVNVHFSLLPRYRGASPVQFAILNGDGKTGITYQLVSKEMDKGDVIFQSEYEVSGNETAGELNKVLFEKAAGEISEALEGYVGGELVPQKQNEAEAVYTYSPSHPKKTIVFKEDARIDWSKSPTEIDLVVRAFNPWPVAWTTLGEIHKHYRAIKSDKKLDLKVKIFEMDVSGTNFKIEKLQVEGKPTTNWKEFENGYADSN